MHHTHRDEVEGRCCEGCNRGAAVCIYIIRATPGEAIESLRVLQIINLERLINGASFLQRIYWRDKS